MGALSEVYVDPAIAADSGTGTIGDPFGDLQFALNTATRDATNGDRFNIKAGTDEILSAALTLATYGTPSAGAPLVFQGYTAAAGDGGIGGISGNGSVAVYSAGAAYVQWRDLHLHNCGAAAILTLNSFGIVVVNCELDNTTGDGFITNAGRGFVGGCYFHDIGGYGARQTGEAPLSVYGNYFANGAKSFTAAIILFRGTRASRNVISLTGASDGIVAATYFSLIEHNSILSVSGTGQGIDVSAMSGVDGSVLNNLIEGFSGTGGIGIKSASDLNLYGRNAVFNCATAFSIQDVMHDLGDNETLSVTPFAKSGADTFANRFIYFAPVDVDNVWAGAFPVGARLDKGAVQHADPAGGSGSPGSASVFG